LFNNREIATAFWFLLFAVWALSKPTVRKSVGHLLLTFGNRKLLACVGAMLAYTAALVASLSALGFWHTGMLKDTVIWFFFSGFVLVMDFVTSKDNEPVFKKILFDNVKVLIVIQFIINTYTMPLIGELVFVPFVTLLFVMDALAKTDTQYDSGARLTGCVISIIGFLIFGYAIWCAVSDFRNLGSMDTFRSIAFPLLMSLLFAPFVYFVVLASTYENIFVRLRIGPEKTRDVIRYAKRRILFRYGLRLSRLREFSKRFSLELMRIQTVEDVDRLLESA